jgi:dinuclear metal center YbgI/SA1388 family protein
MVVEGDDMTLHELDRRLSLFLDLASVAAIDRSRNGLQVGRRTSEVRRVAFAVDASLEAFRRAAAWGAEVLVVHHGLFWSDPVLLVGSAYERVRFLIEHDLALWAAHFPLDIHPDVGNNAGIARQLGLVDVVPFGLHHGVKIGCRGRLPSPVPLARVAELLGEGQPEPVAILAFGPTGVRTVGIVSGGAPRDVEQAVHEGLDAFVTGEPAHEVYHYCREERINALFAGHYRTESHGVKALAAWLARETGLETTWLDVPTGL